MAGWSQHKGLAVVLNQENIDTDQLIPARFMSTPRSEGYGKFLLHDLRLHNDGSLKDDFPLNKCSGSSILVAGRNFGSGSSREAAVYALVDFGIRVVIAPSFGDIFASNSVNNGLLPARVSQADGDLAASLLASGSHEVCVDLAERTISFGHNTLGFIIDEVWQQKLMNGWDDIDLTINQHEAIAKFRDGYVRGNPYAIPVQTDDM